MQGHAYSPNGRKLTQLFFAGAVATIVMTLLAYAPLLIRFPAMDFAGLYGSFFYHHQVPPAGSERWWVGMIWHFFNLTLIAPIAYDFLIEKQFLPNIPWVKGLAMGGLIWFIVEAVVSPLSGEGLFSAAMPAAYWLVLVNLISQLVYGYVLESMCRVRLVHAIYLREREAA